MSAVRPPTSSPRLGQEVRARVAGGRGDERAQLIGGGQQQHRQRRRDRDAEHRQRQIAERRPGQQRRGRSGSAPAPRPRTGTAASARPRSRPCASTSPRTRSCAAAARWSSPSAARGLVQHDLGAAEHPGRRPPPGRAPCWRSTRPSARRRHHRADAPPRVPVRAACPRQELAAGVGADARAGALAAELTTPAAPHTGLSRLSADAGAGATRPGARDRATRRSGDRRRPHFAVVPRCWKKFTRPGPDRSRAPRRPEITAAIRPRAA